MLEHLKRLLGYHKPEPIKEECNFKLKNEKLLSLKKEGLLNILDWNCKEEEYIYFENYFIIVKAETYTGIFPSFVTINRDCFYEIDFLEEEKERLFKKIVIGEVYIIINPKIKIKGKKKIIFLTLSSIFTISDVHCDKGWFYKIKLRFHNYIQNQYSYIDLVKSISLHLSNQDYKSALEIYRKYSLVFRFDLNILLVHFLIKVPQNQLTLSYKEFIFDLFKFHKDINDLNKYFNDFQLYNESCINGLIHSLPLKEFYFDYFGPIEPVLIKKSLCYSTTRTVFPGEFLLMNKALYSTTYDKNVNTMDLIQNYEYYYKTLCKKFDEEFKELIVKNDTIQYRLKFNLVNNVTTEWILKNSYKVCKYIGLFLINDLEKYNESINSKEITFSYFENLHFIKHSCVNNNVHLFISNEILYIRAIDLIERSVPLTYSFVDPSWDYEKRTIFLFKYYKIICKCALCELEKKESKIIRNKRRALLYRLNTILMDFKLMPKVNYIIASHIIENLLALRKNQEDNLFLIYPLSCFILKSIKTGLEKRFIKLFFDIFLNYGKYNAGCALVTVEISKVLSKYDPNLEIFLSGFIEAQLTLFYGNTYSSFYKFD